jgi:hypothetical protein
VRERRAYFENSEMPISKRQKKHMRNGEHSSLKLKRKKDKNKRNKRESNSSTNSSAARGHDGLPT